MLNVAVLVSGSGTNLQALLDAQANGILKNGKIVHVISSRSDAFALERAKKAGVCADVAEFRDLKDNFEKRILELLRKFNPEIIVLAGFMHILSADFIRQCNAKIINIHPALIPSFCGRGFYGLKVHEAVLKAGVKITGATVHIVNEIPDGGKILMQRAVEVMQNDTPEKLQRRVMEQAEWVILPKALEALCIKLKPKVFTDGFKYPGRGIIVGCTPDGRHVFAYFIMGRSKSSRARIFERSGNDLIIKLTNQKKNEDNFDNSLILYSPVRVFEDKVIVTNGDQTDTIYETISSGRSFESALRTREYEPDEPHYTSRISALLENDGYKLSILKKEEGCCRFFFEYEFTPGTGHLIHTYNHDVMPKEKLPSFKGEPRRVAIPDSIDEFADGLWDELDESNKVALYVRFYEPDFKRYQDRMFNSLLN